MTKPVRDLAELVLVSTITVLALVVGLSEVAFRHQRRTEDVSAAFGSLNQSFWRQRFLNIRLQE